ncbi:MULTISPECIES: hypothetical protein [Microbacterium]|uniref:DUF4232 domain-containing protein n=1 Tax=Microbacterium sufflavum TaxID=2851649 RepID=A0ABY4IBU1_9MICO|nr:MULTISPECIES: hypothetical protein [Microbacterium]UPL10014.1 hypothetical protein KV394_02325 [Microbacterium sufflavum]
MPRRSAAVYRRRRLVVLLGLILVLAVIGVSVWLLVARPWAAATDATPAPTSSATTETTPPPTGSASPAPTPSASETPAVVACQAKDIEVTAVTDADTYAAGVTPRLSISLTNKGTTDCTIDVGSSTQVFTVSSGADVWWRSTDCQENPSSMIATLTAGSTVVSKEPVVWDRTRSSVETCAQENRQRAPGGGASYHVAVSIGGFPSATTAQFLLY